MGKLVKISGLISGRQLRSCLFCTKLLAVTIMLCVTVLSSYGQTSQKITLKKTDVLITEIFREIEKKTDFIFMYKMSIVDDIGKISIDVKDADIKVVLDKCLEGKAFTYGFRNNTVVIKPKAIEKKAMQKRMVKGTVLNANNEPLPGVTVIVKGTMMGTATDGMGQFSFSIPEGENVVLQYSFVGYQTVTAKAPKAGETAKIVLQEVAAEMDEVVVTGYSVVRRKDYVGSAVVVDMDDAKVAGVSNVDEMLAGQVPGMTVTRSSGMVGSTAQVRVRGTSTLLGSQAPLWVVDGVIQRSPVGDYNKDSNLSFTNNDADMRSMVSNAISWLNPNDIETITVLKDASATAIYGSSAANGVIVITTKRSTKEQMNINYTGEMSVGMAPSYDMYDRMNSKQMMQFSMENYKAGLQYTSKPIELGFVGILQKLHNKEITSDEFQREFNRMEVLNTDWFDHLFRNSVSNKHSLSITAGTENIMTRASFGVEKTKGEAIGNDMTQYTANSNTTISLENGVKINVGLKGSFREVDGFAYGVSPFNYAYNTSRILGAKDADGNYIYHSRYGSTSTAVSGLDTYNYSIFNELDNTGVTTTNKNFEVFGDIQVPFLKHFKYKGMLSYNFSNSAVKSWASEQSNYISVIRGYEFGQFGANSPEQQSSRLPFGGVLRTDDINTDTWNFRNDFIYDNLIDSDHRITSQLGVELSSTRLKGNQNTRYGYMPDRGETFAEVPTHYYKYGNMSNDPQENLLLDEMRRARYVMNRENNLFSTYFLGVYSYKRKYIFNASARVDASNRFGQDENKKWQPTWSVGLKWDAAEENFAENWDWLDLATLSASYGYQGNSVTGVSPYLISNVGNFDTYFGQYTMVIRSLPNENLGWEKTKTTNLALQLAMLNNRVSMNLEYYHKNSNVLSSRSVAYENGVDNSIVTGVTMKNTGYDVIFNVVPVKTKDFNWQFSLNFGKVKNELSSATRTNTLDEYLNGGAIVNGEAANTLYSFKFKGLSPEDGTPLFDLGKDTEGNDYDPYTPNKITDNPLDYLVNSGSAIPDFSGGFNTRFQYKNWSLYMQFNMQFGGVGRLPAIYDYTQYRGTPFPDVNVSTKLIDRWQKPGDELLTNIPSVPGVSKKFTMYVPSDINVYETYEIYQFSDAQIADTDMIRCGQIALSYELDKKIAQKFNLNRVNMRLGVTNPFFIAFDDKWDGIDPETGNWPVRKMYTFTLNLSF